MRFLLQKIQFCGCRQRFQLWLQVPAHFSTLVTWKDKAKRSLVQASNSEFPACSTECVSITGACEQQKRVCDWRYFTQCESIFMVKYDKPFIHCCEDVLLLRSPKNRCRAENNWSFPWRSSALQITAIVQSLQNRAVRLISPWKIFMSKHEHLKTKSFFPECVSLRWWAGKRWGMTLTRRRMKRDRDVVRHFN